MTVVIANQKGAPIEEVFPELTRDVIDRMSNAKSARLQEVMEVVIRHLHAIVRESKITQGEWWQAIDFLTRAGQMCSESRQELILLSDILGISMLVDAVDHVAGPGISDSTVLGPFYAGHQRELAQGDSILLREEASAPLVMSGRVADPEGQPVADALIEVWQTAPNQLYDVQDRDQPQGHLRASFRTDMAGTYRFRTIMPVSYPIPDDGPAGQLLAAMGRHPFRPAHIHFMISAPGYRTLVTHLFFEGDEFLESDAVFGVNPRSSFVPSCKMVLAPSNITSALPGSSTLGVTGHQASSLPTTKSRGDSRQRMTPLASPLQSC